MAMPNVLEGNAMTMVRIAILGCAAAVWGCTSTGHGTVTQVHDEGQAAVKLGLTGRVAPGDRVAIEEKVCRERYSASSGGYTDCRNVTVGHGTVESLPDSQTAMVRVDPGTKVAPGMFVNAEPREAH